ncbi:MAG: molecular chaperone DnaJ [bacterium]
MLHCRYIYLHKKDLERGDGKTTMEKRDYYDVLGIHRNAAKEEIRRAYRQKARLLHPDVNPDNPEAAEQFKEVSEAYQVLSDDSRRAAYDRFGHAGVSSTGVGFDGFGDFGFGGFGDLFDIFFGGSRGRRSGEPRVRQGNDLRYDMTISLYDAAFGTEEEVEIPDMVKCEGCQGTGSRSGTHRVTCSTCRGTGEMRQAQQTVFGQFVNITTCYECRGSGEVVPDPCSACRGEGFVRGARKVLVKIPAGIDTGTRLRLRGEGELGERGGPRGDLYIFITVEEHKFFKRAGEDIHCEVPVSFIQAALGDEIEVPTLRGVEKLRILAGTQSGAKFRLRNKGMPLLHSARRGDQIVTVRVVVPERLTARQKELLQDFATSIGDEIVKPQKSFFSRFKELFD